MSRIRINMNTNLGSIFGQIPRLLCIIIYKFCIKKTMASFEGFTVKAKWALCFFKIRSVSDVISTPMARSAFAHAIRLAS